MWWLAACVNVVVAPADWPEVTVPATTTGGCAPTGDADITAFSAIPGRLSNQVALRVTTAGDVPVAVRCTLVGGDGEVHLLEDDGGTDHVSHLSGLLPDSVYTCEASATCPRTASPPEPLTVVTGPAPGALAPVRVTLDERVGVSGDYTLFNLNSGGGCTPGGWLQVVDLQGRPRFWHPLPAVGVDVEARFHGDDVFVFGGGETPDGRPRAVTVWDGQVYDSAVVLDDADTRVFHHDGKRLPDGRLMTLELRQNDAPGLGRFEGFAVRVLDPRSRAVEWEWSSQTAVDRGQLPVTSGGDEWHANWADVVVEQVRTYLRHCAGHREELDQVDGKIFLLLEKTLKSIGAAILKLRNIQFKSVNDPAMIAKVYQDHHNRWQDAKSESESAFKKVLKDKATAKALKDKKKDSYPLKFKGGMGPCLEKLAKNMKVLDMQEAKKIMSELAKIAGEYLRLVKAARREYEDADFKGKAFDEVFDPLESALGAIESDASE